MAAADKTVGLLSHPYMVRWFSPTLLANAAVRAMISPVLGTFSDARAVQANVDGFDVEELDRVAHRYDFSNPASMDANGAVWVDYLADFGDGFDSTYAMAYLVGTRAVDRGARGLQDRLPAAGWPAVHSRRRPGLPLPLPRRISRSLRDPLSDGVLRHRAQADGVRHSRQPRLV